MARIASIAVRIAACAMLPVLGVPAAVLARAGHWQPPHVVPSAARLADVLAAVDRARDPRGERARVERFSVVAGTARFAATADVAGDDFAVSATLGDGTYRMGRSHGHRWRARPNGIAYRIDADAQGDDLDRWPLAVLGFQPPNCALIGETTDRRTWVIEDRPPFDSPHWFFVDERSGTIVREVSREGSNVVEYTFLSGGAGALGGIAGWSVRGGGPEERVTARVDEDGTAPSPAALAEPVQATLDPTRGPAGTVDLPVSFRQGRLYVDVEVGGAKQTFLLDDGTPSIDVPLGADRGMRDATTLSHTSIDELDVGPLRFDRVPVRMLDSGTGILGYDFFTSGVIGIDYSKRRLQWTPRAVFAPPSDAMPLEADFREAIPLVPMAVGDDAGTRFAPDFGSFAVVLMRYFAETDGASLDRYGKNGLEHDIAYLEGGIHSVAAPIPLLHIGRVAIPGLEALIEVPNDGVTTDFPVDGVVGVDILQRFDWWFDAGGGRIWYRVRT